MTITCPDCSGYFRVPTQSVGLFLHCPHCRSTFRSPATGGLAEPDAAESIEAPVIKNEARSVRRKSKGEWKLWLVSIGLALVVTPAFVLWRLAPMLRNRANVHELTPAQRREAMDDYRKALEEISEAQRNLGRDRDGEPTADSVP